MTLGPLYWEDIRSTLLRGHPVHSTERTPGPLYWENTRSTLLREHQVHSTERTPGPLYWEDTSLVHPVISTERSSSQQRLARTWFELSNGPIDGFFQDLSFRLPRTKRQPVEEFWIDPPPSSSSPPVFIPVMLPERGHKEVCENRNRNS